MNTAPQRRCLVVEDQPLVGLELEAFLEAIGLQIVGPFASTENALAWTRSETPDVALLDFKLADGYCTEIARTLLLRGVPVVCYSGYPRGTGTSPELQDVTWIAKPVNLAKLRDVLVNLVSVAIAMSGNKLHDRH
jgi:DNA-binding response OmpR family regulator